MRVLFTCVGGPGHLNPLLPISRAVADLGHEVLWATTAGLRRPVEDAGFAHHLLGAAAAPAAPRPRGPLIPPDPRLVEEEVREHFVRRATRERWPHLRALVGDWRPDLVVCDEFDFAAVLAAEEADVPHASVLVTAAGLLVRPDVVGEALAEVRAGCGLPADPGLTALGRYLRLSPFPPSFPAPGAWRCGTEHAVRPPLPRRAGERPDWARVRPGAPVVYFTLGTEFGVESGDVFERVLAGLRELPVNLLMTVGRDIDPAGFGPQPAHVRVERYVAQDEVLPHCDVVVSHGGSGTVVGSLAHGVPGVLVPLGADQPANAERWVELGVGLALDAVAVTPADARAAVAEVLAGDGYRRAAERLRDELVALPGPGHAAALLDRVGRTRRPVTA
ncbi:glycosyltransferase [Saccharothrix syringae]|uniref:Glycosyltransferase n=1 Tax=Saccharothrix syringae TaxID=103733 RepID=A0A5Q0H5L1_SACSY|nr:glycosyltransferase [Saccharothrix syringae]QFZ21120.1 glycosyltransferase [Saccharothrix syringae]